jgi:multiple sugar transport system substrate-binding protein
MTDHPMPEEHALSRRTILQRALAIGGLAAAAPLLAACGSSGDSSTPATTPVSAPTTAATGPTGSGKVIIGAFDDGAMAPFKDKIIPLFKEKTGIDIELLSEPYDSFKAKALQDGQSKAGQFDIYIMDDPWVPEFAAAGYLADLGAAGIAANPDFSAPFIELGYWPPQSGPRVKGFETTTPALVALPTIGDLQTLTYRNDVFTSGAPKTWDDLVSTATAAQTAGTIKYGYVFRGVKGNPIVTSWYPIFLSFGGVFFDDQWNPTFNSAEGKASADFFVTNLKAIAPPGVAEFDSDQEGAAILGGEAAAIIQYSGNAIKSDDPAQSKEVGKLDFGVVPAKAKALAQIGIFIHGVSSNAPNKDNAITFMKWFATLEAQVALAQAGDLPVLNAAFADPTAVAAHRLLPVALAQIQSGAQARPRMPDWGKVEDIIGTELNKALIAGKGGGAALDNAAVQVKAALMTLGYYA